MTDKEKRIAGISERLQSATPGPWRCFDGDILTGEDACIIEIAWTNKKYDEDGEFIADSWADIKFLLEEVETLRKLLRRNIAKEFIENARKELEGE